jgi:plastocyanin
MKRKVFTGILILAALIGLHQKATATIHTVTVGDFFFNPTTVTMQLGDTIQWVWQAGSHTTTSAAIPPGAAAWDSPISSSNQTFMYKPTVAGNYGYVCTPHATMGQVASFTVNTVTAVKNIEGVSFSISPNPARATVTIRTDAKNVAVDLIDATGRLVRRLEQTASSSSARTFSLAGVSAGLYLVQVKLDGMVATEKLFVEN